MLLGSPSVVGVVGEARDKQTKHHNTSHTASSQGYTTATNNRLNMQNLESRHGAQNYMDLLN